MAELGDPTFVGHGRLELVNGLVSLFDEVSTTRSPVWVSLEAAPGVGKTRIAQEFYSRLARDRQSQPPYWPMSLVAESVPSDRRISDTEWRRKRTYPESFDRLAGAEPSWFWWGIACSHRSGIPSQALLEDVKQFAFHEPFLKRSASKIKPKGRRVKERAKEMFPDATESGVEEALGVALGTLIPFSGLVIYAGKMLGRAASEEVHHRRRAGRAEHVDFSEGSQRTEDLAVEIASQISSSASHGFPFVIYVEDLHHGDLQLVELLSQVLLAKSSVLVLTTSWAGELADEEVPAHRLLERIPADRVHRFGVPGVSPRSPFPAGASLDQLDPGDLRDVLRHYLPGLDSSSLERVVAKYPNPLALAVFSSLNKYRQATVVTAEDLSTAPPQLEDLYRESWSEIPETVRRLLSVAASITPREISKLWGFNDERWAIDVIDMALALSTHLADDFTADTLSLDLAAQNSGWAADLGERLRRFNEPVMLDIAVRYGESDLSSHFSLASFRESIAHIVEGDGDTADRAREQWKDQLIIAMAAEALIPISAYVIESATRVALRIYAVGGESQDLGQFANLVLHWLRDTTETHGDALRTLLRLRIQVGLRAGEFTLVGSLIEELSAASADDELWRARVILLRARISYDTGRFAEALEECDAFLQSGGFALLSPGDQRYMKKLRALSLNGLYRFSESIEQLTSLRESLSPSSFEDHRLDLEYAKTIASAYRRMARLDEAAQILGLVEVGQATLLGTTHPDYLATLQLQGAVLRDRGQLRDAEVLFDRLLVERREVLGENHRDTLVAKSHISWLRRHQGRLGEAEQLTRSLLAVQIDIEGEAAPDVIGSMHNLGQILRTKGEFEESRTWLERSLSLRSKSEGQDPRSALTTRKEIAVLDAAEGYLKRALVDISDVLKDLSSLEGSAYLDIPNCEVLRCLYATQLELHENNESLRALRRSVRNLSQKVGSAHPEVARAWVYYYQEANMLGLTDITHDELAKVLRDASRTMDQDHPYLVQLRIVTASMETRQ